MTKSLLQRLDVLPEFQNSNNLAPNNQQEKKSSTLSWAEEAPLPDNIQNKKENFSSVQEERTAVCPVCKQSFWIEARENGAHEFQCPSCFDEGLAVPLQVDGVLLATWKTLPLPDEHTMADFAERAAIREYDGCMSRAEAEKKALIDLGYLNQTNNTEAL